MCLKVIGTGPPMATATEELEGSFLQMEAMSRGMLTSATDCSYIRHLAPNVWMIQKKLTVKKVKGLQAEWSSSSGSYRGKMMGMLTVGVFMLAVEEYFQQHGNVGKGNKVSYDNKGELMTFDKNDKKVPAASSNADVRRALRELDRRSSAKYKLEHVKGHQDKKKKPKSLKLEVT